MNTRKTQLKIAMISTWIFGMLAHAYHILNNQPNHDCIRIFKGNTGTFGLGRWFIEVVEQISTGYNLPWMKGALAFFCIGLTAFFVCELLNIENKYSVVLISAVLVTFPSVTATFSFMFTADAYMFGQLLAILSVYFSRKYKHGWIIGAICLCLALGTYQAEISIAMIMVILVIIEEVINEKTIIEIWKNNRTCLLMGSIGGILYFAVTKAINWCIGAELSNYQGIGTVGAISLYDIKMNFFRVLHGFPSFWGVGSIRNMSLYGWASLLGFLFILLSTGYLIIERKLYRRKVELGLLILCYLSIPFICFIILFVSSDVEYTVTMMGGCAFVAILGILLAERMPHKKVVRYITPYRICGILVGCIIFQFISVANIAYFYLNVSYERSYATCSNLLSRIDALDIDDEEKTVAIFGRYASQGESYLFEMEPYISGITGDTFLYDDVHYTSMWEYYFGRKFELASSEEKIRIQNSEEYAEMDVYPAKESVGIIDDVIVIKMAE